MAGETPDLPKFSADLSDEVSKLIRDFAELSTKGANCPGETLRFDQKNRVFSGVAGMAGRAAAFKTGMIKLISGFTDYSADDLAHTGETVVANLPTLPVFATLKPTSADITAQVTALQTAMAMHGPGRAQAIATSFEALAGLLGDLAVNAPQMAGVTDTDLAETGLPIVKTPVRTTQPPDACPVLRLFHGQLPGEITARCVPPSGNIRVYEAQWTLDPNGNTWSDPETFPNSRALRFTNLPRGKDVWVRVRARNSVGAGAWSDPATIMVI